MAIEDISLLGSPFFTNIILPFFLVFVVVFAMLEKTQVLGKKKDINVIIALIFGLVAVGVPAAIGVLSSLIPVIAVLLIILFAWFLIFGFVGGFVNAEFSPGLRKTFLVLIGVVILGIITWAIGLFDYITLDKTLSAQVMQLTILIGAIIAVIAIVVGGSTPTEEGK